MAASFNSNRNVEAGDIAILKENAWMQTIGFLKSEKRTMVGFGKS